MAFRAVVLTFLFVLVSSAYGDGKPIANAIVTENLEHPPKLLQCMQKLFPFPVKRFVGPMISHDRLRADFAAVDEDGGRFVWRFRPALGSRWKPFLYDGPGNTSAVGGSTTAMVRQSEVVPPDATRSPLLVDLTPCEAHLHR